MKALLPTVLTFGKYTDASFQQLSLPYDGEYQSKTVSGMSVLVPDLRAAQTRLSAFING